MSHKMSDAVVVILTKLDLSQPAKLVLVSSVKFAIYRLSVEFIQVKIETNKGTD